MSGRARLAAALTVVAASIGLGVSAIVLANPGDVSVAWVILPFLASPLVGALIVVRQPANRIGWLFCVMGLGFTAAMFVESYAYTAIAHGVPGLEVAAWLSTWLYFVFLTAGVTLFATFPSGRLAFRRLRPVLLAAAGAGLAAALGQALGTQQVGHAGRVMPNPFLAPAPIAGGLRTVAEIGNILLIGCAAVFALALLVRLRLSTGIERQQLKWFVATAALVAAAIPVGILLPEPWTDVAWAITIVGFGAGLPVAAGLAILRYRLYDIDVVIRRTLVYGAVVAILGGVYVVLVVALQALLADVTGGQTFPVAVSTLAIAALFGTVRRRIRAAVDRRFYRSRYDAQRTLETFAANLRDEVELDAVGSALADVAAQTVQPRSAGVWLRTRAR